MKLKLLVVVLMVFGILASGETVLAGRPPDIVGNCIVENGSVCTNVNLGGIAFYAFYPHLYDFTCTKCRFVGTGFWSVNLKGSNFTGSDFTGVSLTNANLTGVNLSYTNLTDVLLTNSYTKGGGPVNYTGAFFCRTIMPDGTMNSSSCP